MNREQEVFQYRGRLEFVGDFNQHAERQVVVNNFLADIENPDVVSRQDQRKLSRQSFFVRSGYFKQ